ncbi:MAG TPA: ABC transporter permease [Acidimicrobiales bacterium]|nr:ABC transporter permease [Acidimicrobiales bacterium]
MTQVLRPPATVTTPPADSGRGRRRTAYVRTIALYIVTLWAAVTLTFLLPRYLPGDPLAALNDADSGTFVYDAQERAKIAAYYGLDRPLIAQYGSYLSGLTRGDFGWSISQNVPVSTLLRNRLPWTLLLTGSALLLSSAVSYFAGLTAAWHRGRFADRALITVLSLTRAIPEYAIASGLLILFAVTYPVFPQAGAHEAFATYSSTWDHVADILFHLALPLAALTLGLLANKFLIVRNTAIATLGEDYMVLARAKGLSRRVLKYRHSGRNALLPFVTALGIQSAFALGGSVFVETIFAYPGMGTLLERAVFARDYPLLQGYFVVIAVVVLLANLLTELTYTMLDPRVGRR